MPQPVIADVSVRDQQMHGASNSRCATLAVRTCGREFGDEGGCSTDTYVWNTTDSAGTETDVLVLTIVIAHLH